jgi:hypothetical protein
MKDRAGLIRILERRGHPRLDATLEANPILPDIDALLGEHFLPLVIDDGPNLGLGTPKVNRTGDTVGWILVQDRTQVLREMLTGNHLAAQGDLFPVTFPVDAPDNIGRIARDLGCSIQACNGMGGARESHQVLAEQICSTQSRQDLPRSIEHADAASRTPREQASTQPVGPLIVDMSPDYIKTWGNLTHDGIRVLIGH